MRLHCGEYLECIAALGDDVHSGFLRQQKPQLVTRQWLVVGDDSTDLGNHHANFTQTSFNLWRPSHTAIDVADYEKVGHEVPCISNVAKRLHTASAHNSNRYSTDETDETEILKQRRRTVPARVARLSLRRNCLLARERFEALVLISV